MRNMLKRMKEEEGYISIETVIVAGLVIGLGVLTITAFQKQANSVSEKALENIKSANDSYTVTAPSNPS